MTLASGGREGARLWESLTGKPILYVPGKSDFISGLAFSADGTQLAVASQGWPAPPGKLHTTTVHSIQHGRGIDPFLGQLDRSREEFLKLSAEDRAAFEQEHAELVERTKKACQHLEQRHAKLPKILDDDWDRYWDALQLPEIAEPANEN